MNSLVSLRQWQVANMSVDWVGYGYAALVASGGVIGYVKAGMCHKNISTITRMIVK